MGPKHIRVTTLTFQGHVTTSVTWPINSPYAISYCIGVSLELSFQLQPFSRYPASKPVRAHTHRVTDRKKDSHCKWFYILSHAMYMHCIGQTTITTITIITPTIS